MTNQRTLSEAMLSHELAMVVRSLNLTGMPVITGQLARDGPTTWSKHSVCPHYRRILGLTDMCRLQ